MATAPPPGSVMDTTSPTPGGVEEGLDARAVNSARLYALLAEPILSRAFEDFARREHCEENVLLVRRVTDFRACSNAKDRARMGLAIIQSCTRPATASSVGVCVDSKTRGTLDALGAQITSMSIAGATEFGDALEVLSEALFGVEAQAVRELVAGSLLRFLASEAYRTAVELQTKMTDPADRRTSIAQRARGLLSTVGASMRLHVPVTTAVIAAPAGSAGAEAASVEVEMNLATPADRKRSLLQIMAHPRTRAAFTEFCAKEHCEENVALVAEVHTFRCARDDAARAACAHRLLTTFIRSGSPREVNIDARTRMHTEMMLSRIISAPQTPPGASVDSTASPLSSARSPVPSQASSRNLSSRASTSEPEDALSKVETELVNMLSGELLPRFAGSKLWLDLLGSAGATTTTAADGSRPSSGAAATQPASSAAPAATSTASAPKATAATPAAPVDDIVARWAAALGSEDDAGGKSLLSLRDKHYVFGMSLTTAMRSLGAGPKRTDLEAVGVEIRRTSIKSGYLVKRAHHKSSWKRRWFVLTPSVLAYFPDASDEAPAGAVLLSEVVDVSETWTAPTPCPPDVQALMYTFIVRTAHRPYPMQAANNAERARWIKAIDDARKGNTTAVAEQEWTSTTGKSSQEALAERILGAVPPRLAHAQVLPAATAAASSATTSAAVAQDPPPAPPAPLHAASPLPPAAAPPAPSLPASSAPGGAASSATPSDVALDGSPSPASPPAGTPPPPMSRAEIVARAARAGSSEPQENTSPSSPHKSRTSTGPDEAWSSQE